MTQVAPAGVEWQVLNDVCEYHPAQWKPLLDECRGKIDKVRRRDITLTLKTRDGKPLANRGIRVQQTQSAFLWGFGAWGLMNALRDGTYAREDVQRQYHYFAKFFNTVNLLHYWVEKHCDRAPVSEEFQGYPDYSNIQQGVDWALANGLTPKGHPIYWSIPKATPQWLYKYDYETRMKFLEVRVRTITARFKGKMKLYDAINEMLWEPTLRTVEQRHWPHITPTEQMCEYIELVLKWAREEDPDARYLINDYGVLVGHHEEIAVDTNEGKRITRHQQALRYVELLQALKARGAAPDAVGLQGFFGGWGHHDRDIATLDALGTQTGLPVIITEFGASTQQIKAMEKAGAKPEQISELVGQYIENVMVTCFAHQSVEGFYYWYNTDLLLNGKGYPSALYHRLSDLIHKQWRTDETLKTDANGRVTLRGFCGDYRVRLMDTPQPYGVGFSLPEQSRGAVAFELVV